MNALKISFDFEGKQYEVDMEAYNKNLIQLPDGRILQACGWLETNPPRPMNLIIANVAVKADLVKKGKSGRKS